ncbi:MAG: hypothetical protein A3J83_06720 [Elusimicrobia bacterium RIFOXYA2_FULL_40_6]|nr:MAG: hypothetical protein A3J83_06720 [Elusimicrobia bacterium RIFOXYA2_FULL_40_6]
MRRKLLVLSFASLVLLGSTVSAQEEKPKTEIGGVIYADYFNNLTKDAAPANISCFELTRLYLTSTRTLSEKTKMKATLEGNQPVNQLFIKNAYIEFNDACCNSNIRAGVIPMPWIGYEEGIWKNRFIAKTFTDINAILNAADIGIGFAGKLANKSVDYDLALSNGEGYKTAEVSSDKDLAARVSYEVINGVKLHAFENIGKETVFGLDRNRTIAGLSFEQSKLSAMAYYLAAKDAAVNKSGFSLFGSYSILSNLALIARIDSCDPNTDAANDSYNRIIAGVSSTISEGVQLGLSAQLMTFENTALNNQTYIYTSLEVKY